MKLSKETLDRNKKIKMTVHELAVYLRELGEKIRKGKK